MNQELTKKVISKVEKESLNVLKQGFDKLKKNLLKREEIFTVMFLILFLGFWYVYMTSGYDNMGLFS